MKNLIAVLALTLLVLTGCRDLPSASSSHASATAPAAGRAATARAGASLQAGNTTAALTVTSGPAPRHTARPARANLPHPTATVLPSPTPTSAPTATATPKPFEPLSWLHDETLLTIYGRAFGVAPILGRLGMDNNFADLEWQIQPFAHGIKANTGGKETRITVHLIYAMAVPCSATGNCLYYLDDAGFDVVKDYILPARRRHWLVVLDDQLGLSDPATEVRRMIDKGYLRFDNVEVALDPEFRVGPGQSTPGIPVGSVTAAELNQAQALINAYSARRHLLHRKVMMVHQFRWEMITDRAALRSDFPYVDPVIIADGFGSPGLKADIYSQLLGPGASAGVKWRGIKLFYPNPYEMAGHLDYPLMTWAQVFGHDVAIDSDGKAYRVRPGPNVVVIA